MKMNTRILKRLLLCSICFIFTFAALNGQGINKDLRSLDSNHILATDTNDWNVFRKIKEIPLTKYDNPANLSIGGEIREQLRVYHHLNYGDANPDKDYYLLQRYMVHADLYINKNLRIFTQLNSTHVNGKNTIGANDRDYLGIMQAFIDVNLPSLPMRLRFGRQEFLYGSERILGPRDGPNNRQMYDGLRYTLNFKKITGDFILVNPVAFKPGFFDNIRIRDYLIFAGYWTFSFKNKNFLDLYYFGTSRKNVPVEAGTTSIYRNSLGARISKSPESFYYDIEGTLQGGSYNTQNIYGWHFTSIIGYRWNNIPLSPRFQLKGAVFSGNKDSTDNQINSFVPISAKPPVNDMLPVGPTNLVLFVPEGEIKLNKSLALMLRYFCIWRLRRTDGLYSTDMERMIRPPDKPGQNNGNYTAGGPAAEINYTTNKHFNISLTASYFIPGIYIKSTGAGKDLQAMIIKAYYRF
jgi:hypothetical protein